MDARPDKDAAAAGQLGGELPGPAGSRITTSQIPHDPITPEAMSRLTRDEQQVFIRAAQYVAEDHAAPIGTGVVADLVLMAGRLITAGSLTSTERDHVCTMWEQAYMDVQAVLDRALGTREEDGAGIAADVALLAGQRDEARAQLVQRLEAYEALSRVAESKTRELYAAWIEVRHGSNNDIADEILAEACDGFGGPQWNGTETGIEWLERTCVKPCGCDSSRRCLDCATDDEALAAIPDFPGSGEVSRG